MNVKAPESWDIQDGSGQEFAVGGHNRRIWLQGRHGGPCLGAREGPGLKDGQPPFQGKALNRRRARSFAPSGRLIGLGVHAHKVMSGLEQAFGDRNRELGGSHEDYANLRPRSALVAFLPPFTLPAGRVAL